MANKKSIPDDRWTGSTLGSKIEVPKKNIEWVKKHKDELEKKKGKKTK